MGEITIRQPQLPEVQLAVRILPEDGNLTPNAAAADCNTDR